DGHRRRGCLVHEAPARKPALAADALSDFRGLGAGPGPHAWIRVRCEHDLAACAARPHLGARRGALARAPPRLAERPVHRETNPEGDTSHMNTITRRVAAGALAATG